MTNYLKTIGMEYLKTVMKDGEKVKIYRYGDKYWVLDGQDELWKITNPSAWGL